MNGNRGAEEQRGSNREVATWAAVGVLTIGCAMLMVSLIMPPPGQLDHTVLVAFGEICTFAGAVLGVARKKNKKEI